MFPSNRAHHSSGGAIASSPDESLTGSFIARALNQPLRRERSFAVSVASLGGGERELLQQPDCVLGDDPGAVIYIDRPHLPVDQQRVRRPRLAIASKDRDANAQARLSDACVMKIPRSRNALGLSRSASARKIDGTAGYQP